LLLRLIKEVSTMDEPCRKALRCIAGENHGTPGEGSCRITSEAASKVELLDAYSRAVTTVVDAVGPTVVGIAVRKPANANIPEQQAVGSGVIFAPDGYILTNDHVVCHCQGRERARVPGPGDTSGSAFPPGSPRKARWITGRRAPGRGEVSAKCRLKETRVSISRGRWCAFEAADVTP